MLEEPLRKATSDGSVLSGITIKFSAQLREGANADELQATNAVTKATERVSALGSTPPVVGLLGSAVGTGTNVVTEVQTFETTWGVLLKRMELFNEIVAGVAAVFGILRHDSLSVRMRDRFIRICRWLGLLYQLRIRSVLRLLFVLPLIAGDDPHRCS